MTNATVTNNPLLIGKGLPTFDKITPDHIIPAIMQTAIHRGRLPAIK